MTGWIVAGAALGHVVAFGIGFLLGARTNERTIKALEQDLGQQAEVIASRDAALERARGRGASAADLDELFDHDGTPPDAAA